MAFVLGNDTVLNIDTTMVVTDEPSADYVADQIIHRLANSKKKVFSVFCIKKRTEPQYPDAFKVQV
jgi:predicted house-cleaning NTP pyrophosphatase (Maf/HAM1 superfamily)